MKKSIHRLNTLSDLHHREALKRLKQETAPATYMPDFDKDKCIEIINQDLDRLDQLEKNYEKLKLDYLVVEKYACKYKSLIRGKLWRDGKTRTKWFNTIRSQKDWVDYLSHLRECQSSDDEQLLRIVNHLDTQVLYWALLSLEKEIKRYSEEKFEDD